MRMCWFRFGVRTAQLLAHRAHHVRALALQGSGASSFRDPETHEPLSPKGAPLKKIKAEVRSAPFSGDGMEAESSRRVGRMGHGRLWGLGVRFQRRNLKAKSQWYVAACLEFGLLLC